MFNLAVLTVVLFTAGFYLAVGGDVPEERVGELRRNGARVLWGGGFLVAIFTLSSNALAAVSMGVVGWMVPGWIAAARWGRTVDEVRGQLRDLLVTLLGLFRNQRTVGLALTEVGEQLPDPLGPAILAATREEQHKTYNDFGRVFGGEPGRPPVGLHARYGLREFATLAMLIRAAGQAGSARVADAVARLGEAMDQAQNLGMDRAVATTESSLILRISSWASVAVIVYGALHPGNYPGVTGYLVYGLATAAAVGIILYTYSSRG